MTYNTAKVHLAASSLPNSQEAANRLLFQNPLETTLDAPPRPGSLNTTTNNDLGRQLRRQKSGGQLSPTHNLAIPMGPFRQNKTTEMGGKTQKS